ncbi:MAG: response regulator transcription factor [Planctomycetota bacterium]
MSAITANTSPITGLPAERGTVFVIDDDEAVLDSLRWLIESIRLPVRTYPTAAAFLAELPRDAPGCVVVDVRLPGMSGLDLQDRLNELELNLPVVVITGHGDVPMAIRAMKAGAFDFLEKPFSDEVLLDRVRAALQRDALDRRSAEHHRAVAERRAQLTPRERQVMDLVVQGKLNKQIASELELSHKTIEVHRAHVMEKMAARSLAELVRMAVLLEGVDAEGPSEEALIYQI